MIDHDGDGIKPGREVGLILWSFDCLFRNVFQNY